MAAPKARAFYDAIAQSRRQPVFSITVADFFNAPSVAPSTPRPRPE